MGSNSDVEKACGKTVMGCQVQDPYSRTIRLKTIPSPNLLTIQTQPTPVSPLLMSTVRFASYLNLINSEQRNIHPKSYNFNKDNCKIIQPNDRQSRIPKINLHVNAADEIECIKRNLSAPSFPEEYCITANANETFSRKVFVGGLPFDITEGEIFATFCQYGSLHIDWPRSQDNFTKECPAYYSSTNRTRHMTGYVFLVYHEEISVKLLINHCYSEDDKHYLFVSSPTMKDKPVQVRPWRLLDIDFILNPYISADPRRTIFIGGLPRPTKAHELADLLNSIYGSVCYVGIDIDPELKYPKGAARVTFMDQKSFFAAISGRFVRIPHADITKRVEIKSYIMEEQMCDECDGLKCASRFAPYFCGELSCLEYFCEYCWDIFHYSRLFGAKRSLHKPIVRVGDQTKQLIHPPHHKCKYNTSVPTGSQVHPCK